LGALSLDLFAVLFGGAVAMIPVFAKDILKAGPVGFGWLNAASDIGSILIIHSYFLPAAQATGKEIIIYGGRIWALYCGLRFVKNVLALLCCIVIERDT
jgi:hypothetical protein